MLMTHRKTDLRRALVDMIPCYLTNIRKEGARREDICKAFYHLDPTGRVIREMLDILVETPCVSRQPPRNLGGRPRITTDMAEFWLQNNMLSQKERAHAWMQEYPNDPRTVGLSLNAVRERLRGAARRHFGDKRLN